MLDYEGSEEVFSSWLLLKPQGAIVGKAGCSDMCPLADFLNEVLPQKSWVVERSNFHFDGEQWPFSLPRWAQIFVDIVDRIEDNEPITRETALEKLELALLQAKGVKYSLLVSNVGWVRGESEDCDEVKTLYNWYKKSKQYEQVTLWSSEEDDPIEEAYLNEGEDL